MKSRNQTLTSKQQVFVSEYLIDGNATRAAIAAGYSEHTAGAAGSRMLKNVKVRELLAEKGKKLHADLEISARNVLQGIANLATFNPRRLYNPDGSFKRIIDLDDETARCITSIRVEKLFRHFGKGSAEEVGTVTDIKWADTGINYERLGKHLKLFTEKFEVSGDDGVLALLTAGRKRAANG